MKTAASKNKEPQHASRKRTSQNSKGLSAVPPPYTVSFANIQSSETLQAKLNIGRPGDKYEREADAMADRIMRMPEQVTNALPKNHSLPNIQRKCAKCKEEEKEIAQKPLMLKSEGSAPVVTSALSAQLARSKGGGASLPLATNAFMSRAFGTDFSHVRIHTGNKAAEMNRQLDAKAFTHGRDIYFNQGRYNPASQEGKRLLAHELTHVNQQIGLRGYANKNISIQRKTESCYKPHTPDKKETIDCERLKRSKKEINYSKAGHSVVEVKKEKCYILGNFEIGSADFSINTVKTLQELGKLISAIQKHIVPDKDGRIYLTGFTDCKGSKDLNNQLRINRANFVQKALSDIDKNGLTSKFILSNVSADQFYTDNTVRSRLWNRSVLVYLDYRPKPKPKPRPKPTVRPKHSYIRLCCSKSIQLKVYKAIKRAWSMSSNSPLLTKPDSTTWLAAAGSFGISNSVAWDVYDAMACHNPSKDFNDIDDSINSLFFALCTDDRNHPGVPESDRKICAGDTDAAGLTYLIVPCPAPSSAHFPSGHYQHPLNSSGVGQSGQVH